MVRTAPANVARQQVVEGLALRLSRYEHLCLALSSALLLLGTITLLMLLIWLTASFEWSKPPAEVSLAGSGPREELIAPRDRAIPDFQPPGEQELPLASPPVSNPAMESIAAVVQSQFVTLDALAELEGDRRRSGNRPAGGDGPPGGGQLRINPDAKTGDRWEVRFSTSDIEEYKRQLDFFGIELGVAGGGVSTVDYAKGFSAVRPTTRLAQDPKQEQRIRFLYRDGPLKRADRELARAAGIDVEGRVVFQFYANEVYQSLLKLEFDRMKPHRISEVVRTVFGVRTAGEGYEFYVIRQDYRLSAVPHANTINQSP